jgi:tyrosyl-tRNA synthetase
MGKTAQGAVWLNAERLSPYEYWQFWRNTEDDDVGRFLRLFTELDLAEIEQLEHGDINQAKKVLATEATALCHGREAAETAVRTASLVFLSGRVSAMSSGGGQLSIALELPRDQLKQGLSALELFNRAGLAKSNSEARRLIRARGARINDILVDSETKHVSLADLDANGMLKLSAGRKRHALVRPV